MIEPGDSSRTAAELERRAIGDLLLEPDMYSFSLQEVCEKDVRWIAAYVANDGRVSSDGTFSKEQYAAIDSFAPYAFLPYSTWEVDEGCGPGVSTGFAVIVKSEAGAPAPKTHGLTNATYAQRLDDDFTSAQLQESACDYYFDAQANWTSPFKGEEQFRANGCQTDLPDLRGLTCVQTTWRASATDTPLRATSCSTHIHGLPEKSGPKKDS